MNPKSHWTSMAVWKFSSSVAFYIFLVVGSPDAALRSVEVFIVFIVELQRFLHFRWEPGLLSILRSIMALVLVYNWPFHHHVQLPLLHTGLRRGHVAGLPHLELLWRLIWHVHPMQLPGYLLTEQIVDKPQASSADLATASSALRLSPQAHWDPPNLRSPSCCCHTLRNSSEEPSPRPWWLCTTSSVFFKETHAHIFWELWKAHCLQVFSNMEQAAFRRCHWSKNKTETGFCLKEQLSS